jgi:hypothetical protein
MPGGRPTKLTDAITDQVAAHLRTGHYLEATAALVGVSKQTIYTWCKAGARARDKAGRLNATEQRAVKFLDAVETAQAEALDRDLLRHAAVARGGLEVRSVIERTDAQGNLVERVTKVETLAPNARALEWRMERRHPEQFGRRGVLEVTGKDGGPLELTTVERAERLAEDAALFLAGAAEQAKALPASTSED